MATEIPPLATVKEAKLLRYLAPTLLSLMIIIATVWLYYQLPTLRELQFETTSLKVNNAKLLRQNKELKRQHKTLSEKLQDSEQAAAIQKVTNKELQLRLTTLQDEVIDLNRELDFYQNVTQGNTSTKLQIRELTLTADSKQENRINYRLVITQGKKITAPITGAIQLFVTGENKALADTIKIAQHQLKLRYVQVLDGQITLAEGFNPKTVTISLKQNTKTTLSKDFDWKVIPNLSQPAR